MNLLKRLYLYWFITEVVLVFVVLYPITFLFLIHKSTFRIAHFMNRVWGALAFTLVLIPWWTIKEKELPKTSVYCANHFSYLDIPALFLSVPGFFSIIGKAELNKVPLFGFMFKRLYISVDRSQGKSRYQAYEKGRAMVASGRSIVIYPEGGIRSSTPPKMSTFKEGAFKIAIEENVSVVPVTIYNNWIIYKDGNKGLTWRPSKVKFHSPIDTKRLSLKNVEGLKHEVFGCIERELKNEFGVIADSEDK